MTARPSGVFATQAVFGLLVVATIGAFFVTTRLKRSAPVVDRLTFDRYLSPNGDGSHDVADIRFRIKRADEVTVTLISEQGDEVRTLARDVDLNAGRHGFRWNGRLSNGRIAPDGEYRVRVGLRHQGRSITSARKLFVDTRPPRPVVRYVTPDSISPDGVGSGNLAKLSFSGSLRSRPTLLVYRTDLSEPRLVARLKGRSGSDELTWDGLVGTGGHRRPAPGGNYVLVVRTQDAAGNTGPPALPPARGHVQGHPGLIVRYLAALPPLAPVGAGQPVRFTVESDGRRYHWSVRRLGSHRILRRGSSRAPTLRLHAPRQRSGVFLLGLRVGRHRYQAPFAVQGRRRGRVLVVLPTTTWQARNQVDANGDGFADVLPLDRSVALQRPLAGHGFPAGFSADDVPLLLFLDRVHLRYDITTDLALAGGRSRPPIRYRGILFTRAPWFFPTELGRLTMGYLDAGGRVAWVGTRGFTSAVKIIHQHLEAQAVSGPASRNLFGERLRPLLARGQLAVLADRIQFFRGVGDAFGPFPSLEQSAGLPRGARLLASAGHEADRPSLVVYRRGGGIIARIGVDRFAQAAANSSDVARIMRRLWTLLSR